MANSFDAELIRRWAAMSVELLRTHRTELNALNVFPVPDGDTGTNLYLTFRAAAEAELNRTGSADDTTDALQALARGALLGARGNSGVMLASVLAAMADEAKKLVEANTRVTLLALLRAGATAARASVLQPVEGTALTVLDAAANLDAFRPEQFAQAAREALALTPEMLPALKAAGVVDAGGRGVVLLLDALVAAWAGNEVQSPAVGFVPLEVPRAAECSPDAMFELMFLTTPEWVDELKPLLQTAGTSIVITSGAQDVQVHVHLNEPAEFLNKLPSEMPVREIQLELLTPLPQAVRIVAQVFGPGLVQTLAQAGVQVVSGEPNLRPSVQDFVAAGVKAQANTVLLLPSDTDSIAVAELAANELQLLEINAEVVATTSLPQTLAAVSVFDVNAAVAEVKTQLEAAADGVKTIAVTTASRAAETPIGEVRSGEYLFLVDGELAANAVDVLPGLTSLAKTFESAELITVLVGTDAESATTVEITNRIHEMNSEAEIDVINSGQKIWHYLIGVE